MQGSVTKASPGPSPQPQASPAPSASPNPSPLASPTPVVLPSLKPGEVVTWIKLERPRFAIGEIIVGSFALAGLVALLALVIGLVLGHVRSKRAVREPGGLKLRE